MCFEIREKILSLITTTLDIKNYALFSNSIDEVLACQLNKVMKMIVRIKNNIY